eukprot:2801341-Lingulodinium_polyedra.AAC.1
MPGCKACSSIGAAAAGCLAGVGMHGLGGLMDATACVQSSWMQVPEGGVHGCKCLSFKHASACVHSSWMQVFEGCWLAVTTMQVLVCTGHGCQCLSFKHACQCLCAQVMDASD